MYRVPLIFKLGIWKDNPPKSDGLLGLQIYRRCMRLILMGKKLDCGAKGNLRKVHRERSEKVMNMTSLHQRESVKKKRERYV